MSVYIKGEKMPKCCDECWALDDDGDYPRCRITEEQRGYTFRTRENRMSKCPLVNSESYINQEYDMTREVAQFILAYMDVHNDLESKAICMAIDALKMQNNCIICPRCGREFSEYEGRKQTNDK